METRTPNWYTFDEFPFSTGSFVLVWGLALALYGVGDIVTTIAVVWFSPLYTEANPVVDGAIQMLGGGGLLSVKLIVIYASIAVSLWSGVSDDDPLLFYGPPLVLAGLGGVATISNLLLMV